MLEAWRVVRAALRDTWRDLLTTAVVNLMWLGLTLLVVTAPPATLALFYVGNRLARGESTDPRDFLHAFRRYFRASWRWGLLQAVVLFVLIGDIYLTGRLGQGNVARLVQSFYLATLGVWLLLQLYVLPFLFEQESPELKLALRNGIMMLGRNLRFSMALGLILTVALLVGTLFFLVSVAAGSVFVALVGNHAVLNRLAEQRC